MAYDLNRLLEQDMISLTLNSGIFDVDALAARLAQFDYFLRDAHRPERFIFATNAEVRDGIARERQLDPQSPFPMLLNLEVRPEQILIWPVSYTPELKDLTSRVLTHLLLNDRCLIENDLGLSLGNSL